MLSVKPIMGWNSWNTFAAQINEKLIMEMADAIVEKGYLDAGYEYIIIDDCWARKRRVNGKLDPNPEKFPHGMKYLADYVHSKGLKFGIYSCAGSITCAGYPGSYGYEYDDAKMFASWGVDYLKYDFCNFSEGGDKRNAYLTMAMALRNCGRDIVFAACNWGVGEPAEWMRSHGAHTYRSTGDIRDSLKSFTDIFRSQYTNIEGNAPGCYNDLDMLIVGMRNKGHVGAGGCTDEEYLMHFAMWAFLGSPLIIGADIRKIDSECAKILLNKTLIALNQDDECRPAFPLRCTEKYYTMAKILDKGKIAMAIFNINEDNDWVQNISVVFNDLGVPSNKGLKLRLTDAVTGEDIGIYEDGIWVKVPPTHFKIYVAEIITEDTNQESENQ